MRAVIVTSFDTYYQRISVIEHVLKIKNIEYQTYISDFSHVYKKKINPNGNRKCIKTFSYRKSISVRRFFSHYLFAQSINKILKSEEYDLLYIIVPPNSLLKPAINLKNKGKIKKVIIDVQDLWPESFPLKSRFFDFLFSILIRRRNAYLAKSDFIITECNLYKEHLNILNKVSTQTVYLAKNHDVKMLPKKIEDIRKINFIYLGSINNIIDIDLITNSISKINTVISCKLIIVGDGENRLKFIESLKSRNIEFDFIGYLFDKKKLDELFKKSHFGINMYKTHLKIGLTMKSVDYFYQSLPILNNIPGDTWSLIEHYDCGFNVNNGKIDDLLLYFKNLTFEKYRLYSENSYRAYIDNFDLTKITSQISSIVDEVFNEK
ncbi:MAG TPA: hypothetical protein PLP48_00130 [Acholeplasmataceae bacterium]|nr:hypothetical protein [Acholeplasmataceae bacterium]